MVLSPDIHGTKSNTLNFLSTELFKVNVKKRKKQAKKDFSKQTWNKNNLLHSDTHQSCPSTLHDALLLSGWAVAWEVNTRNQTGSDCDVMTLICRETTLSSVIDAAMNTSVLGTTCLSSEQCHMQMLLQTSRILLHQERVSVSMWPGSISRQGVGGS